MPDVGGFAIRAVKQPILAKIETYVAKTSKPDLEHTLHRLTNNDPLLDIGNQTSVPDTINNDKVINCGDEYCHMRDDWFTKGQGNWPNEDVEGAIRPALIAALRHVLSPARPPLLPLQTAIYNSNDPSAHVLAYGGPVKGDWNTAAFYLYLPPIQRPEKKGKKRKGNSSKKTKGRKKRGKQKAKRS